MRNFASTLVKFSKLSHIQTTIWRPPKMAPLRTAGSAGPFVTPLTRRTLTDSPWLYNNLNLIIKNIKNTMDQKYAEEGYETKIKIPKT